MTIIVKNAHLTFVWNFTLIHLLEEHYVTASEINRKNTLMSIYLLCNSKSIHVYLYHFTDHVFYTTKHSVSSSGYLQLFQMIYKDKYRTTHGKSCIFNKALTSQKVLLC